MNTKVSFFLLSFMALLLLGTACERHPASQTIPGYEEQKAAHEKAAAEKKIAPAGVSTTATFFSKQN